MPIFLVQYEARPTPNSPSFASCGGAFINCWIKADTATLAEQLASASVRENAWSIVAVEEPCHEVTELHYNKDEQGLRYFQQAVSDGECYVYHRWSNERQEDDDLH